MAGDYNEAMNLTFERGDPERPSGHAVLYFTTGTPERVLATYLIIPPITFNLARYLPPMFASMPMMAGMDGTRPVPLPPVPEEVSGRGYLTGLAEARNDDLIYAGNVLDDEPQRLALEVGYAADDYGGRYEAYAGGVIVPDAPPVPELDAVSAVYSVMGEGQRLAELTKLTGALREATERGAVRGAAESLGEMRSLVETLPAKYRGSRLLAAAQEEGDHGRRLCQLLLERAYALQREEYLDAGRLDKEIDALDTQSPS